MGVKDRIAYIDGLRAIAVLSVVACHASPALAEGAHGVDLFFVLSGFCLAYPTLSRRERDGTGNFDVLRYTAHRLIRIVPPYWIAIICLFGLALLLGRNVSNDAMPALASGFTPLDVIRSGFFIGDEAHSLNRDFWTLAVEFRWYLAFPVLLLVWMRSRYAFTLVALACPVLILAGIVNFDLFVLPTFMLGIVAADVYVRGLQITRFAPYAFVVTFALGVSSGSAQPGMPAWELSAFLFVISSGANKHLSRLLSAKGLTTIGVASYSIYLIHDPVLVLLAKHSVAPPLASVGGIGAGFAFWWLIERPVVAISKYQLTRQRWTAYAPSEGTRS